MMLLRLVTLGAIGYAAYRYYDGNRESLGRRSSHALRTQDHRADPAGGPISGNARVVHAGEDPVG
jgi:hypothetical protein